jgi:hypothetical protein
MSYAKYISQTGLVDRTRKMKILKFPTEKIFADAWSIANSKLYIEDRRRYRSKTPPHHNPQFLFQQNQGRIPLRKDGAILPV